MSLVNQLMNGVTESSVDLSGYNFFESASMESYYLDAACESLVSDIFSVDKAFHVADVVGEVAVIKEGADPEALLEGMVSDAIEKLKESFKKFLAKIKAWAAKVKKFFKVLFMKGKDLAKQYGSEIRKKSTKGFKYKGYKYTIDKGDDIVDTVSSDIETEIKALSGFSTSNSSIGDIVSSDTLDTTLKQNTQTSNQNKTVFKIYTSKLGTIDSDMSTSDYQDKLIGKIVSGCSDLSDLTEKLNDAYRDGDTDKIQIDDFEGNDPSEMLDFLETFDKGIRDIEKEEKRFEKDVNTIIKALDKLSGTKDDAMKFGQPVTYTYKKASKVSSFISAALSVRKSVVDTKVQIYKEINSSWTSVLKSFVLKKEVKESAFFEDFDSMIALTEAAEAEPEVPEEEPAGEGCGKKTCESLLEAAYNYI